MQSNVISNLEVVQFAVSHSSVFVMPVSEKGLLALAAHEVLRKQSMHLNVSVVCVNLKKKLYE